VGGFRLSRHCEGYTPRGNQIARQSGLNLHPRSLASHGSPHGFCRSFIFCQTRGLCCNRFSFVIYCVYFFQKPIFVGCIVCVIFDAYLSLCYPRSFTPGRTLTTESRYTISPHRGHCLCTPEHSDDSARRSNFLCNSKRELHNPHIRSAKRTEQRSDRIE